MRLDYNATHDNIDKIDAAMEEMWERMGELERAAYEDHHHATFCSPSWFGAKGQTHLDMASEIRSVYNILEDWRTAVYDYAERDGFKGVAARSFTWAFRQVAEIEECM